MATRKSHQQLMPRNNDRQRVQQHDERFAYNDDDSTLSSRASNVLHLGANRDVEEPRSSPLKSPRNTDRSAGYGDSMENSRASYTTREQTSRDPRRNRNIVSETTDLIPRDVTRDTADPPSRRARDAVRNDGFQERATNSRSYDANAAIFVVANSVEEFDKACTLVDNPKVTSDRSRGKIFADASLDTVRAILTMSKFVDIVKQQLFEEVSWIAEIQAAQLPSWIGRSSTTGATSTPLSAAFSGQARVDQPRAARGGTGLKSPELENARSSLPPRQPDGEAIRLICWSFVEPYPSPDVFETALSVEPVQLRSPAPIGPGSPPSNSGQEKAFRKAPWVNIKTDDVGPNGKYRGICKLNIAFSKENRTAEGRGTGWLISDSMLVTAAHVVLDDKHGFGHATGIKVSVGCGGKGNEKKHLEVREAKCIAVHPKYHRPFAGSDLHDLAVIELGERLLRPFHPFKWVDTPKDSFQMETSIISFPQQSQDEGAAFSQDRREMRESSGPCTWNIDPCQHKIPHWLDTEPGSSGAPLLRYNSAGSFEVLGVHTGGRKSDDEELNGNWAIPIENTRRRYGLGNCIEDFKAALDIFSRRARGTVVRGSEHRWPSTEPNDLSVVILSSNYTQKIVPTQALSKNTWPGFEARDGYHVKRPSTMLPTPPATRQSSGPNNRTSPNSRDTRR